ncbi:hypothetical protein FGX01_00800, partial [Xylella fastidiosa subsp. multiplex]|nr:hypothetical protein [Xylella fastidiosa subsp. multiplex]
SRRPFSIASLPVAAGPAQLEFQIRRMPGGGFTERLLPRLMPGDALTLDGLLGACTGPSRGWRRRRGPARRRGAPCLL